MKYKTADRVRIEGMEQYGFGPRAMKRLKVCKSCGRASPSSLQFCTECGAHLPEKNMFEIYKERHAFCKACETVVSDTAAYCPECGERL